MNKDVLFSSKKEDWETPQGFYMAWDAIYHFTLDAAADHNNHKCPRYFTREEDGLLQSWEGETVWCNPPYGRDVRAWVKKAYAESQKPGTTCVMLLPSRTDTAWFQDYVLPNAKTHFVRGRVKFVGSQHGAPFPSLIAVFGEAKDKGGLYGQVNP